MLLSNSGSRSSSSELNWSWHDPHKDKDETSTAAHVYMAFSDSTLGKDPKILKEATGSSKWPGWKKAIKTKFAMLDEMDLWELANMPDDRQPVTNKWVFVRKYNKNGNLQKYRAWLVARGFSQMPGVNFNETFAPIVWLKTICAILALAVKEDWEIQQTDIKCAYLNGDLEEEMYMKQLEGFNDGTAWLFKTLYGWKQSGWEWNNKLDRKLQGIGFKWLQSDPCVYIWKTNGIEIIIMWVNNLLHYCLLKKRDIWIASKGN